MKIKPCFVKQLAILLWSLQKFLPWLSAQCWIFKYHSFHAWKINYQHNQCFSCRRCLKNCINDVFCFFYTFLLVLGHIIFHVHFCCLKKSVRLFLFSFIMPFLFIRSRFWKIFLHFSLKRCFLFSNNAYLTSQTRRRSAVYFKRSLRCGFIGSFSIVLNMSIRLSIQASRQGSWSRPFCAMKHATLIVYCTIKGLTCIFPTKPFEC